MTPNLTSQNAALKAGPWMVPWPCSGWERKRDASVLGLIIQDQFGLHVPLVLLNINIIDIMIIQYQNRMMIAEITILNILPVKNC